MSSSPPDEPAFRPTQQARPATAILADGPSRAIVLALGEARARGVEALAVTEQSIADTTPRLVRDRLRALERANIVIIAERAAANGQAPSRWSLTPAGRDLYRLHSLMTRIVSHAADLHATTPTDVREGALDLALESLVDPVVRRIATALAMADRPLDPVALEAACAPVPRRTLYRRLGPLVDHGVVLRHTGRTVPRSTSYELAERWRPVAAIPVLSAWWESRHWQRHAGGAPQDLAGILHAILPMARIDADRAGQRLRWAVEAEGERQSATLLVRDGHLLVAADDQADQAPAAEAAGTPAAWATAMITDGTADLTISGDEALAREAINAVRAALLAYIR
ncbi:MAG: hypothetical protein JHD16_15245 [Solirubrobacteraceae bacterium]|nr:hypothetical protein [Solirubrobacteraceae bacterium]